MFFILSLISFVISAATFGPVSESIKISSKSISLLVSIDLRQKLACTEFLIF